MKGHVEKDKEGRQHLSFHSLIVFAPTCCYFFVVSHWNSSSNLWKEKLTKENKATKLGLMKYLTKNIRNFMFVELGTTVVPQVPGPILAIKQVRWGFFGGFYLVIGNWKKRLKRLRTQSIRCQWLWREKSKGSHNEKERCRGRGLVTRKWNLAIEEIQSIQTWKWNGNFSELFEHFLSYPNVETVFCIDLCNSILL